MRCKNVSLQSAQTCKLWSMKTNAGAVKIANMNLREIKQSLACMSKSLNCLYDQNGQIADDRTSFDFLQSLVKELQAINNRVGPLVNKIADFVEAHVKNNPTGRQVEIQRNNIDKQPK